ncbi:flagellar hook-length control protein FliK [Colwellia piezophila]|uniref:flagellar hook-length control protein FliK n=1 Tax=Colwellia piezophila TaxID=211668 RepID=UPI0003AB1BEC|nr:flagellar hook-length control protein FliK [Colwellia piezophila]
MQPVNVLPSFLSQEADLKPKEPSSPAEARNKANNFSSLVDQYASDEVIATTDKESQQQAADTVTENTARNSHTMTKNEKHDNAEVSGSQKSDYPLQESGEFLSADNDLIKASDASKENASNSNNSNNTKALDESEQFIALLYNSDKTLTFSEEKSSLTGQSTRAEQVNNQQIKPVTYNEVKSDLSHQKVTAVNENSTSSEENTEVLKVEPQLKDFSTGTLLARTELKVPALSQQFSEQVLKGDEQPLQAKKEVIKSQSITSEPLLNTQLANEQLKNNQITDLTASVALVNKSTLSEQKDLSISQLPAESVGKNRPVIEDKTLLAKQPLDEESKAVNENNVKQAVNENNVKQAVNENNVKQSVNENNVKQSVRSLATVKEQLAVEVSEPTEKLTDTRAKIAIETPTSKNNNSSRNDHTTVLPDNKLAAQFANLSSQKAYLENINLDKTNFDQVSKAQLNTELSPTVTSINENIIKEQATVTQIKPSGKTISESQLLPPALAAQNSQSSSGEVDVMVPSSDEYVDAMLLAEGKSSDQNIKATSKLNDNVAARSLSELQIQTMQSTQVKQTNDAYNEHQATEVINHSVASDMAQIQKNNVQLQQESIAIYRKDFADAVKDKVMISINQKLQRFDITLDPPEFGNMQVRVNLQGDQATVSFVVQNQQAKEVLEQNMHKLRDMLAEQGVDVGGASVEQQNQQQKHDESELKQGANSSALVTSQGKDEQSGEQVFSATVFDSSATGVDYYA